MRLHGCAGAPAKGDEAVRRTEIEKPVITSTSAFAIEKPAFGGALSCSGVKEWPRKGTLALWFLIGNQLMEMPKVLGDSKDLVRLD